MRTNNLQKYADQLYHCIRCGICREFTWKEQGIEKICPIHEYIPELGGFESTNARGKMIIARALLEGQLKITDKLIERLYICSTCGNCKTHCPAEVDTVGIIEALRADILKEYKGLEKHVKFGNSIKDQHNPYFEPHINRLGWIPRETLIRKNAEVTYFVGCTSAYRRQNIARDTVKILQKANVSFSILDDEWCCGSPLLRTGYRELAEEVAKHNVDLLNRANSKKLITSCAGCYKTIKHDYPEQFGLKLEVDILHVSEYINNLVEENKIKFDRRLAKEVTYHDPCHLGRAAAVYDAPRNVLKSIPGLNLIEMYPTRENSLCCGAGGGVKAAFGDWATRIAEQKINNIKKLNVDTLISTCPFCHRNLEDAVKKIGTNIQVKDLTEIVAEAF